MLVLVRVKNSIKPKARSEIVDQGSLFEARKNTSHKTILLCAVRRFNWIIIYLSIFITTSTNLVARECSTSSKYVWKCCTHIPVNGWLYELRSNSHLFICHLLSTMLDENGILEFLFTLSNPEVYYRSSRSIFFERRNLSDVYFIFPFTR